MKRAFHAEKQIGALERAFGVLEWLARTPERAWPLGAVAEGCGLHRATCAHILAKLVALGYAEQEGPRGGYRLGPAAHRLARGAPWRPDLVRAAEPLLARLSRETGESVVLMGLRGGRRVTLGRFEGGGALRVAPAVTRDDLVYRTPTGRLLLAHASPRERATCLALNGPPGDAWPEAQTGTDMEKELEALRRKRGCLVLAGPEVAALACPVLDDGQPPAALGLYLPASRFAGERRRELPRQMLRTAKDLVNDSRKERDHE